MNKSKKTGQTIIEPLLVVAIYGFVLVIFVASLSNLLRSRTTQKKHVKAARLAQEGVEVAYNLAINADPFSDFVSYATGEVKHPDIDSYILRGLADGPDEIDGRFTRSIVITEDGSSYRIECDVSWGPSDEDKVSYVTYLINLNE